MERIERQQDRRAGEHHEAGVVDPHPAVHVAEAAEGDDQHRLHQQVPHDHPQQVADVPRRERIEVDAAEDRRQRDDDDRAVERRHEHRQRRVRQRDPLVAVVGAGAGAASDALSQALEQRCHRGQLLQLRARESRRQRLRQPFGPRDCGDRGAPEVRPR